MRGTRRYFCIEFHATAQLFFASDSDEYIMAVLQERNADDLSHATIMEEWPDCKVYRDKKNIPGEPGGDILFLRDERLPTVRSARELMGVIAEYPELDGSETQAIKRFLATMEDPQRPTIAFLELLEDLLRSGDMDDVAESAKHFLLNALSDEHREIYQAAFDAEKIRTLLEKRAVIKKRVDF